MSYEIAMLERRLAANPGGFGCLTPDGRPVYMEDGRPARGLGELTMPQMHVALATTSFALGALAMHLLHRFKVMK